MMWYWWVLVGLYAAGMATTALADFVGIALNSAYGCRPAWKDWVLLLACSAFWPCTWVVWLRRILDDGE